MADLMEAITSLAKRRGIAFQSSEIYGGLRSSWDYGPLGVELKRNVRAAWWRSVVQLRDDVVGLEASIIMSPRVWEASGHLESFTDPLVECLNCHQRFRADHLSGFHAPQSGHEEGDTTLDMGEEPKCPNCGHDRFTDARNFNLMFKTHMAPVEDEANAVYLRPETAQGMFVDFPTIQQTTRKKFPFGIPQVGKSFRNELIPGNFIFRTPEFEQMELEFFVRSGLVDERHDPYVIEPAAGVDRALLAFLVDAYRVEEAPTAKGETEKRTVLALHKDLAPYKVAVLPLSRNESLVPEGRRVFDIVKELWMCDYDDAGSIGRRYRRQDEVGTPFCVTVDFDTLEDRAATVRDRDSMTQERIPVASLVEHLRERL